jgi:nucleotide-binding universal stress UspA family protein
MFNKILVAVDGSETSAHALEYARNIAEKWDSELIILSVVPPITHEIDLLGFPVYDYNTLITQTEKYYKSLLTKTEKDIRIHPKVNFRTILEHGKPCKVITGVSENENIDLIIMGNKGKGGVTGHLLGSTSHRVSDHCKMPILLVK